MLWNKPRPNFEAYSPPAVYKPKDGPAQVIVPGSNTLDAYSLDKGERLCGLRESVLIPKVCLS